MSLVTIRRELTKRTIRQNPMQVVFTRRAQVPDGAGGWKEDDVTLEPQTVRLFLSSVLGRREVSKEGGQLQFSQAGLLAEHDADIQRGDKFERDGRKYKVEKVDAVRLAGEVVSIQCVMEEVV